MELEELKTSWNILNERLEKSEMLNKRIIKEMITGRTQSAYERLFRYDLCGLILSFLICLLFPILTFTGQLVLKPLSFAVLEGCVAIGFLMQVFFMSVLVKFDLEKKKLCELARLAYTYKLWMKRNHVFGTGIAMCGIIAFLIIEQKNLVAGWEVRMAVALLFCFIIAFFQIRFYLKNIRAIEKGLEELKEFKEEPDQNKSA